MPLLAGADQVRFRDIAPATPDVQAAARRSAELLAQLEGASAGEALEAVRAWDGLRDELETHGSLVELRFHQDTTDADHKRAQEQWDAAKPTWTEAEIAFKRALLAHPERAALERELGSQAFQLWESEALAFDPAIKADLVRESALELEYTELCASAELEFRGETLNLSGLLKYRQHAERAVRHDAERLLWGWFTGNAAALDRIFDDLVRLRGAMARKLGFEDFIGLGYKRMCRVDYDRADVERLRAAIVSEVVPLAHELTRRQAATLGVDPLMAWDEYVQDPRGNPVPRGDHAWSVARAREMFDRMGSGLGAFFRHMDADGFLDLVARKGKAGGGFCTSFPTHGMPFVFSNFNGTKGDVEVLTHEIGHAFQAYQSGGLFPSDYHWPTYESAEVHSMSLELLTWPHMELFFGDDAERFRRCHLVESLLFLPYGSAVDHFQHEVYAREDASPAERHGMWQSMERRYLPWRDWGDLEHPARGGRWQHQSHVYGVPFYYIDYVLAQLCAFQMWALAEEDREHAMHVYVQLCQSGGKLPFQELIRSAGLQSPFDDGCIARTIHRLRPALDL